MRDLTLQDAKRLAAGIKASLPDDLPVHTDILAHIGYAGHVLTVKLEGHPPFTKTHIIMPDGTVTTYLGHPEQV